MDSIFKVRALFFAIVVALEELETRDAYSRGENTPLPLYGLASNLASRLIKAMDRSETAKPLPANLLRDTKEAAVMLSRYGEEEGDEEAAGTGLLLLYSVEMAEGLAAIPAAA